MTNARRLARFAWAPILSMLLACGGQAGTATAERQEAPPQAPAALAAGCDAGPVPVAVAPILDAGPAIAPVVDADASQDDAASSVPLVSLPLLYGPDLPPGAPPDVVYVAEGDSITAVSNEEIAYPEVLATMAGHSRRFALFNPAVGGETVASMLASAAANVDAHYNPAARRNIASIFAAINDIGGGNSAAATWSNEKAWLVGRRAVGWKTILFVTLPTTMAKFSQSELTTLRTLQRTEGPLVADYVIDLPADPRLSSAASTDVFSPDGLHPNSSGKIRIAWDALPAFEALVK